MTITALSDGQLLEQARHGDEAAFTELYVRHQPAALRLARTYRQAADPDDLVNGAFERVLGTLRHGEGPTGSFRAYVFVTLRRLAGGRHGPADRTLDVVPAPVLAEAESPELAPAQRELAGHALESLPDGWQAVRWHTAVEGSQASELAGALGVSTGAAAAMTFRARERYRQAYLRAHLLASPAPTHEPYRPQLAAHLRGGLAPSDRAAVESHLRHCDACTAVAAELADVDRSLARAVVPLFVLAGGGTLVDDEPAAAAAAAGAGAGRDAGLLARLRHAAPTVGSTAAIAAVLGGIVGMGAVLGREDSAPLSSTADAADIGAGGRSGTGFDGGDGRGGSRPRDGDTLFGEDDFALSPFDDRFGDLGGFGDRFDLGRGRGPGITGAGSSSGTGSRGPVGSLGSTVPGRSRTPGTVSPSVAPPSSPRPSSPPSSPPATTPPPPPPPTTTPPPPTTTPPLPPPPPPPPPTTTPPPPTTTPPPPPPPPPPTTTPPPPPPPPPPPAPAPLAFAGAAWMPTGAGTGTLSFTIGEAGGAPDAPASDPAEAGALVLRVVLSGPAMFATDGLQPGCTLADAATAAVECTFDQPASGATVSIEGLPVEVTGPDATASAEILRDGVGEATLAEPVALTPFE